MKSLLFAAGLALVPIAALHAQSPAKDSAQEYPNRPLRQIVAFLPGGGVDSVTRIVAATWGEFLGQPIVVEKNDYVVEV